MDVVAPIEPRLQAGRSDSPRPDGSGSNELDVAAKAFEKLMVQRMLSEARRTSFGDEPSNAERNYTSMFDDEIAGLISESGSLGLADSLRRSLGDSGELTVRQAASPATGTVRSTGPDEPGYGLDAPSLATLRALVEPGSFNTDAVAVARATGSTSGGMPAGITDRRATPLLASLAARTARAGRAGEPVDPAQQRNFVARLHTDAQHTARRLGTSTDAVLAIAALETGWGQHPITDSAGRDSHNLFGIKSHSDDGPSVTRRTTEYIGGHPRRVEADFRKYSDSGASIKDFGDFLMQNPRYAPVLDNAADPEDFLRALQEAGYATDPYYADKAIRVMQRVREHLAGDMS